MQHFVPLARKTLSRVEANTGVVAGAARGQLTLPKFWAIGKKILFLSENFRQKLRNSGQAPIIFVGNLQLSLEFC